MDIRTGSPNSISKVAIMHPIGGTDQHGNGHYISDISFTFKYVAGYTPAAGQLKKGRCCQTTSYYEWGRSQQKSQRIITTPLCNSKQAH